MFVTARSGWDLVNDLVGSGAGSNVGATAVIALTMPGVVGGHRESHG
jgi:hypothetical protein